MEFAFFDQTIQSLVIWLGVFLGAMLIFDGLRQVILRGSGETEVRNRRMRMTAKGVDSEQIFNALTRHDIGTQSEDRAIWLRVANRDSD